MYGIPVFDGAEEYRVDEGGDTSSIVPLYRSH